ncbi:MAG TPA: Xaa-Pro peptidase family protein [Spirochaetia bacterium]|nr:Xaa-Pro peptidase family protein [Spirochaetia bacterium]
MKTSQPGPDGLFEPSAYAARRAAVAARLKEEGIAACLFEDTEGRRDPSIRYLSGQPGDALLVVSAEGSSILVAWDVNMARLYGRVDEILAYGDFQRRPAAALGGCLERLGVPKGSRVELPAVTPYPKFVGYVEALPDFDLVSRESGIGDYVLGLRAAKDGAELALYRRAAALTDGLMDEIEAAVRSGRVASELDIALFIEREARSRGCEGTGFETIAAGPSRSFGIHAFPAFGSGPFGSEGMSILDFGLKLAGYTTDVTMSFVRGRLPARAERMIELVEAAYAASVKLCAPGTPTRAVALAADEVFAKEGFAMPHALGHGIGLEAHEAPAVRSREDNLAVLAPGHIITIEPGLYDPALGGVRLENDVLITEGGHEVITHARIVRL